jgi:pimeloyl-ACP methyl ester carboxylesterase
MVLSHSIRGVVLSVVAGTLLAAQQPVTPAASNFLVLFRGARIGTEEIFVARRADGWTITSSGRIGAPLELVTKNLQVRYEADWAPRELDIEATVRGQEIAIRMSVAETTATTRVTSGGQTTERTDTIDRLALLMPNPFFAAYEALAARLNDAQPGSSIPVYQGAATPTAIRVGESHTEQIQTVGRLISARRTAVTLAAAGLPDADADIWTDETGRLLRVSVPAQNLEFVRDDIASVSTRRVPISRRGDIQVRVPANGFTLAGTLSAPDAPERGRLPAIILLGGSGPADRDETVAGIPVLGQLAGELADGGFLVLRYDKRGIGQSGGRVETAGLPEFAEDLRAAVKFLMARKDVDTKRVAVVGHSEGGWVALLAATRERRVAAVVLMASPGMAGTEVVLAQQKHLLDRSNLSEDDKQAKVTLQKRIHEAVLTGKGWEAVPAELRRQVDNAEFRSVLLFDPMKVIPDVRQPILILQGQLDTQVDPSNADRLEALARARKRPAAVELVKIPSVNHLFVPATTGEVDEYESLKEKHIVPALSAAIVEWLQKTAPADH